MARKALRSMPEGGVLEVLATDPLAPGDLRELADALGHQLVSCEENEGSSRTLIRVTGVPPR